MANCTSSSRYFDANQLYCIKKCQVPWAVMNPKTDRTNSKNVLSPGYLYKAQITPECRESLTAKADGPKPSRKEEHNQKYLKYKKKYIDLKNQLNLKKII